MPHIVEGCSIADLAIAELAVANDNCYIKSIDMSIYSHIHVLLNIEDVIELNTEYVIGINIGV